MAASANDLESVDEFTCPVCIENAINPRYLPTCHHTFCENCLFTFVLNLKQNERLGTTFECPVCRKPNPSPENGEVTLEWIQTFQRNLTNDEMNFETLETEGEMCNPCREQGECNIGIMFCLDCQELLCNTCLSHHKKFKLFKGHKVIQQEVVNKEAVHDLAKYRKCHKHPDRDIEMFCKNDESLCCIKCVAVHHRACNDVVDISDMEQARTDANHWETKLKFAIKHLNLLETLETKNLGDVKTQLNEIPITLSALRDQVVNVMDKMVIHANNEAKQRTKEAEIKHVKSISKLEEINGMCEKKMAVLKAVLEHGSDTDIFIAVRSIDKEFQEIETNLIEVDANTKMLDTRLGVHEEVNKISMMTSDSISSIKLEERKGQHSKYTPLVLKKNFFFYKFNEYRITLTDRKTYAVSSVSAYNGRIISCGFLFADLNYQYETQFGVLFVFSPDSKSKCKELEMTKPFSAAFVDENHIAVSIPRTNTISIVSVIHHMQIGKTFKTKFEPRAITVLKNGFLAVSWKNPYAFGIVDISGSELAHQSYIDQDKSGRKFKSFDYLAVDEKRFHVVQPCTKDRAVYCFSLSGEPVFKYTNRCLETPRGVTLDGYGNIFVCDRSCIHQLSPDGQQICIIPLCDKYSPLAICFDSIANMFWISSATNDVVSCYKLCNK